jgi:hypothetical protein
VMRSRSPEGNGTSLESWRPPKHQNPRAGRAFSDIGASGLGSTTSCLQVGAIPIPRKIGSNVVLTCGTLYRSTVPFEYHMALKTR